jgi:anti-anti-sigma regulatory factor
LSSPGKNAISFVGDVTISSIGAARDELDAALRLDGAVIVDIGSVDETDLTFVQLIESARRKAAEAGRDFTLRQPADGSVLEVLRRGGFLDDETSERAKFWLQGTAQ